MTALEVAFDGENAKEYEDLLRTVPNFVSAEQHYLSITEQAFKSPSTIPSEFSSVAYLNQIGEDVYVDRIADLPIYANLANKKGQLIVGNEVFTVKKGSVVIISSDDFADFANRVEEAPSARFFSLDQESISTPDAAKVNIAFNTGDYSPRRRVRGEIEQNRGFLGLSSVFTFRVKTRHFRRGRFRIFFGEKADMLTHFGAFEATLGGQVFVAGDQGSNTQSLNENVGQSQFGFDGFGGRFGSTRHEAEDVGMGNTVVQL